MGTLYYRVGVALRILGSKGLAALCAVHEAGMRPRLAEGQKIFHPLKILILMRITGGAARSIQLKTLDLPELRPATDAMRVALFNSLAMEIPGRRFLDLFAGCGAVGLEAFSRGASGGVFVERHRKLAEIIKGNLAAVAKSAQRDAGECVVACDDVFKVPYEENSFDIIFCDPPYAIVKDTWGALCEIATRSLKSGGLFLTEHPAGIPLATPDGFVHFKTLGGKGERAPNMELLRKK